MNRRSLGLLNITQETDQMVCSTVSLAFSKIGRQNGRAQLKLGADPVHLKMQPTCKGLGSKPLACEGQLSLLFIEIVQVKQRKNKNFLFFPWTKKKWFFYVTVLNNIYQISSERMIYVHITYIYVFSGESQHRGKLQPFFDNYQNTRLKSANYVKFFFYIQNISLFRPTSMSTYQLHCK